MISQMNIIPTISSLFHRRRDVSRSKSPAGVNLANLVSIPRAPIKGNQFTLANVNTRSVRNKVSSFVDYVIDSKLDICFVTETWLNDQDSVVRNEITPDGYVFKDHHRNGQIGGGTGVLCRSSLGLQKISGGQKRSFEYSEYSVKLDNRKCHLHAIYRPPYSEGHPVNVSVFCDEFADYLESVVILVNPIVISNCYILYL